MELLFRLSEAVSSADSLEATFAAALDGLAATLHTPRASILLFDESGLMRFRAARGLSEEYKRAVDGHSPWKRDEADPQPIFIGNVSESAAMEPYAAVFARERISALAFVPLVASGKLLGKFMLYYGEPQSFAQREERLAVTIARNLALAVARQQAAEENRRLYREAEAARLAAETQRKQLAAVLDQLPLGVALADPDGTMRLFNRHALEIRQSAAHRPGAPEPAEPPGRLSDFAAYKYWRLDGTPIAAGDLPLARAIRGERVEQEEIRFERRDGSRAICRFSAAPIYDDQGETQVAVVVWDDVTEARKVDAEREKTRETFISILGHDLRNPLNTVVMGLSILMKADDLPPRHAKLLGRMARSADSMTSIISNVLDLAYGRLGGGIPITPAPCDLAEVCERVIEEAGFTSSSRSIRFQHNGDLRGAWDGNRVAQAVSNLVGNAIKHGRDPIDVLVERRGDEVAVEVSNTGDAIPAEMLGSIFEPFRGRDRREGLGLGLFIVSEIARAHGGRVSVSSTSERTVFTLVLPRG